MGEIAEKVEVDPSLDVKDIPCVEMKDLVVAIRAWVENDADRRELSKDCWKKGAIKDWFRDNGLYKKNYREDHYYTDEMGAKKHARGALLWYRMKVAEEDEGLDYN